MLPLFAFSATGVGFGVDLSAHGAPGIFAGVVLGLVVGKPLGICASAWLGSKTGIVRLPDGAPLRTFIGAACLCGIGDTVSLLLADQAFASIPTAAAVAKIGVLVGSLLSALIGTAFFLTGHRAARTG